MWWTLIILTCLFVLVWWRHDALLIDERRKNQSLTCELDELVSRLYGDKQKYEVVKQNFIRGDTPREQKIAIECADKGIPRTNKIYPQRFRGTRR